MPRVFESPSDWLVQTNEPGKMKIIHSDHIKGRKWDLRQGGDEDKTEEGRS